MKVAGMVCEVFERLTQQGNVELTLRVEDDTGGQVRIKVYPEKGTVLGVGKFDRVSAVVRRVNPWTSKQGARVDFIVDEIVLDGSGQ